MANRRLFFSSVGIFLALSLVAAGCATVLLVRRGKAALGPSANLPPSGVFAEKVLAVTWENFGGRERRPEKIGALRFFPLWLKPFFSDKPLEEAQRAETQLPCAVAGPLVLAQYERTSNGHKTLGWQLDWLAGSTWLAGHWSTDQILSKYLSSANFGHSRRGLRQAAILLTGIS